MANDALGIRVIEFPLEATEEDLNASSKVLVDTPQGTKALDGDILGSLAPSIAEKFNKNKSYEDGDVVMHRGALRRFKGPHQGDWTDSDNDATDVVALIEEASTQYVVFPCSPEDLPDGDIIKGVVDAGLHPALKFSESACTSITYLPLTANYTQNGKEFLVFASGPHYIGATKNLESDSSEWEWEPLCDANMRVAGLVLFAPRFSPQRDYGMGERVTYDDGKVYVFRTAHPAGDWTGSDVYEDTFAFSCGGVNNGGRLNDSNVSNGVLAVRRNNAIYSVSTDASELIIELILDGGKPQIPNIALQIQNTAKLTLYMRTRITNTEGPDIITYAGIAEAAVNELDPVGENEAWQVTCVGGCWTCAKFVPCEPPSPPSP